MDILENKSHPVKPEHDPDVCGIADDLCPRCVARQPFIDRQHHLADSKALRRSERQRTLRKARDLARLFRLHRWLLAPIDAELAELAAALVDLEGRCANGRA